MRTNNDQLTTKMPSVRKRTTINEDANRSENNNEQLSTINE